MKKVKKLEADFLATVNSAKKLALCKKEELKKKKANRTFKILDNCKLHGGLMTPDSMKELEKLDAKQLLAEVAYLRLTIAPDIRQMRRVKIDGRYRMQKFTDEELKNSIKNALKPEANISSSVEVLLKNAF